MTYHKQKKNISFFYVKTQKYLWQYITRKKNLNSNFHFGNIFADTASKIKFSIIDFFSKCDQIRSFLRIWPHLLKKSLMENFTFCAL